MVLPLRHLLLHLPILIAAASPDLNRSNSSLNAARNMLPPYCCYQKHHVP